MSIDNPRKQGADLPEVELVVGWDEGDQSATRRPEPSLERPTISAIGVVLFEAQIVDAWDKIAHDFAGPVRAAIVYHNDLI